MNSLTRLACLIVLIALTGHAPAAVAPKTQTCCEKSAAQGKDCEHKCCVAAHKQNKSCQHCNPNKEDLKAKKADKKKDKAP